MSRATLAQRVEALESQLEKLQGELRVARHGQKNWRRSIGAFTDDKGMQEILREALRLREADRKKARPRRSVKRKPKQ